MATNTLSLQDFSAPATLDSESILLVGTATTVIKCGGFTILTDPNFLHAGDHAHIGYGLTSERLRDNVHYLHHGDTYT
ncbi:MBL fold metallo-hydrolase [Pelotalea chapellei]|uniref:Uncharacterized protein n=1 Tax=Pelotalea chapellei TaxID=44671 RepID=A0ABS5U6V7_9BACT|nr:MBL fold metallo-hydrolase [Pelotalea chapellei]MBT1071390.1 hypothetical protein [Pelotalea chapellei]